MCAYRASVALSVVLIAADISMAQSVRPAICVGGSGTSEPIIDVHQHARAGDVLRAMIAELDRHNVIAVVVSSPTLPLTLEWTKADKRFVPSLAFRDSTMPVDTARTLLQQRTVHAFGELGFQYAGLRPDDPSLAKYFALAEEFDVPVAIHMSGGGLPNEPNLRIALGNPLYLEEVLVRHPKLRVNVMHAGFPFLDGTVAIMRRYTQVYADLSKISDATVHPREQFHEYLRGLLRADLGKRLMYGSDAAGPKRFVPALRVLRRPRFYRSHNGVTSSVTTPRGFSAWNNHNARCLEDVRKVEVTASLLLFRKRRDQLAKDRRSAAFPK